jgi:hypothetical protein
LTDLYGDAVDLSRVEVAMRSWKMILVIAAVLTVGGAIWASDLGGDPELSGSEGTDTLGSDSGDDRLETP